MTPTRNTPATPTQLDAPSHITDTGCQRVLDRIANLDPTDARGTAARLIDELAQTPLNRVRFALRERILEAVGQRCFQVLPSLQAALDGAPLPLDAEHRTVYQLADTLLDRLDQSYRELFDSQSQRLFGRASIGRSVLPVVRSMQLGHERLALCWHTWSRPPRGLWTRLHALYQLARHRGLARRAPSPTQPSAETLYKRALLTAFADPYHFMPGEYARARALIDTHAELAQLATDRKGERRAGLFVVRSGRDHAGYAASKVHQVVPREDDLVLDAAPVAAAVNSRHPEDPARTDRLGERLALRWGSPPVRRMSRLGVQTRVALHVGLEACWRQLTEGARIDASAPHWLITNAAADGYALLHLSGPVPALHPGDLVSLAAPGVSGCPVCVVRWHRAHDRGQLEIGVETLSNHARAVHLHAAAQGTDPASAERSTQSLRSAHADTDTPREPGEDGIRALLLPDDPRHNQPASIVMPAGPIDARFEAALIERHSRLAIRPTRVLERMTHVQRVQFSPCDQSAEGDSSRVASG